MEKIPYAHRWRFAPPLRFTLTMAFVLATSFGIAAIAGVWLSAGASAVKGLISNQLKEAAIESAQSLRHSLVERRREMELAAAQMPPPGNDPNALRLWLRRMQEASPFDALITFVDVSGKIVTASNRVAEGADVSGRDYFRVGLHRTFVSDAHRAMLLAQLFGNPDEMRGLIDISTPIYAREAVVGVLAAHLSTEWIGDIGAYVSERVIKQFPGARFEIRDASDVAIFAAGAPLQEPNAKGAGSPAAQGAEGPLDDLQECAEIDGIGETPSLHWTVIVRAPASDAFAFTRRARILAGCVGGVALVLSALSGWWLAGALAEPLEGYAGDVVALGSGVAPHFRPAPAREINDLGAALRLAAEEGEIARAGRQAPPNG